MSAETPFVSAEEIAATPGPTYGLTEKQIRFDIRNGYLPGTIDYRQRIVVRRAEWNDFLSGDWTPAEPGSHKQAVKGQATSKPVGIHSIQSKAS